MIHEKNKRRRCVETQCYERTTFNLRLNLPISNEKIPIITQK